MNYIKLSTNFETSIDSMGVKRIGNFDLESASADLLAVTEENLDESLSMQPTGTAYYRACFSAAKRNLKEINFLYELWRKEKYLLVKSMQQTKLTIADLEAKVDVDNRVELLEWQKKITEAQQFVDNCESMYEAWNQKSYSLSHQAKVKLDDWNSGSGSILVPSKNSEDRQEKFNKMRNMIGKAEKKGDE